MLINANQIDPASLNLAIQRASSGAPFSGNLTSYLAASGWIGPLAVTITGAQEITGTKSFKDSPRVPYSGHTGTAPSSLWVNDQIAMASGGLAGIIAQTNANLTATGAVLVALILEVSGSLTGQGGGGSIPPDLVYTTGDQSLTGIKTFATAIRVPAPAVGADAINLTYLQMVSGVLTGMLTGAGGGASSLKVTGSANIASPNFTGAGSVFVSFDGTYVTVSGSGSNGGGNTTNNYFVTGTGVVAASSTGVVTNTFNITSGTTVVSSSGTVNNTFNGTVTNTTNNSISLSGITGNFVNMSFYFDESSLYTGLNLFEAFVGRSFFFTGYAIGAITSGTQGAFSGAFYQRTPTNIKTQFVAFSMTSGNFFTGQGGFTQTISGMNRVGLDIYSIGTGLTGLSVGLFGVGY